MGASLTHGSTRLGPLFSLLYIIYLSKVISDSSKPFVFVNDTSIIIANSDPSEFKSNINL
jgi:hypothetical protein